MNHLRLVASLTIVLIALTACRGGARVGGGSGPQGGASSAPFSPIVAPATELSPPSTESLLGLDDLLPTPPLPSATLTATPTLSPTATATLPVAPPPRAVAPRSEGHSSGGTSALPVAPPPRRRVEVVPQGRGIDDVRVSARGIQSTDDEELLTLARRVAETLRHGSRIWDILAGHPLPPLAPGCTLQECPEEHRRWRERNQDALAEALIEREKFREAIVQYPELLDGLVALERADSTPARQRVTAELVDEVERRRELFDGRLPTDGDEPTPLRLPPSTHVEGTL